MSKIDAQLKVLSEYLRLSSFDDSVVSGLVSAVDLDSALGFLDSVLNVANGFSPRFSKVSISASLFTSVCALSMVEWAEILRLEIQRFE